MGDAQTSPPARRRIAWWRWAVGIVLLLLLLTVAGPQKLYETLLGISPGWALVTVAVASVWLLLGGLNVWLLLRCLAPVKLRLFLSIYIASWAASNIVPGQLGDATQIVLLRRYDVPVATSSAAYLVDKSVSLVWMLMVAAFGVALYTASLQGWWLLALPVVMGVGGLAALTLLRCLPRSVPWVARLQDLAGRLGGQLAIFRRHPRRIALNVFLTVTKWTVLGTKYSCAFLAFGAALPFAATSTIPVASSLVGYIPVTAGGIGTTEWTAVALFEKAGAQAEVVVGVYLFLRLALLLIALFFHTLLHVDHQQSNKPSVAGR